MKSNEKYNTETKKVYESYGRFAIEFEQLFLNVKTCITFAFHADGLKDQQLIRILLSDQTAYPLIAKLRSIIAIKYAKNPEVIEHLKPLFKFCLDINEKRNEIVHSAWFVGWTSNELEDFDVLKGVKDKLTSKGIRQDVFSYSDIDFNDLTDKIIIAKNLFLRLVGCITFGDDVIKVVKQSEIDKL